MIKGANWGEAGPSLNLYTPQYSITNVQGGFDLNTDLGNNIGNHKLRGRTDGTLTWEGNDLAGTAIKGKSINNNGYISYTSGLILQYGNTDILNESSIVTLPISFSVRNCATVLTVNAGQSNDAMYSTSVARPTLSTIDCGLYVKNHSDGTSRILKNASAWFIAIGY